jgi:SAM-dependent methyltransferase
VNIREPAVKEAEKSSALSMGHHTALELLKRECPSGLIVDAGAFPGVLTRALAQHWEVIALDKEPARGLTAQQRFHGGLAPIQEQTFADAMQTVGVPVLRTDIETDRWPLESACASAVVLTEVIEHLYVDPIRALLEVNRILKPRGILLISTPNLLSIRNRANFLRGAMAPVIQSPFLAFLQKSRLGHFGHVRLYAPSELREMLGALGFETRFRFFQFGYWDAGPHQMTSGVATTVSAAKRCSWGRKLIRSPRSYARAAIATSRTVLERAIPEYRPHMYVIARKLRNVTDVDLSVADFKPAE